MIKIKCANPDSCYLYVNGTRKHRQLFADGFYHNRIHTAESQGNWIRFCEKYGLAEMIFPSPIFKIVGCRNRDIADSFYYNVVDFPSTYFTMKTKDGRYMFVVCLPDDELKHYSQKSVWLGDYKGYEYVAVREDLPSEYTFQFDEHHQYRTLVWKVIRNEKKNGKWSL